MKKTIAIVLALFSAMIISPWQINAQEGAKVGFSIRPMVSYSYCELKGNYAKAITDVKYRNGFQAGVAFERLLPKGFSIQPELIVANQGGIMENKEVFINPTNGAVYSRTKKQESSITSIIIPLSIKYKLFKRFYVELGAQMGFMIKANQKLVYTNTGNPALNTSAELNLLKDGSYIIGGQLYQYRRGLNEFELSINSGLSYFLTKKLSMRLKYNFGITDLNSGTIMALNTASSNIRSSVISLGLGWDIKRR